MPDKKYDFLDRAYAEGRLSLAEYVKQVQTMARSELKNRQVRDVRNNPSHLGLSPDEASGYSLLRALEASVGKDWSRAGFEQECSRAIADRLGKPPNGFYLPLDIPFRDERTLTAGTATTGAEMVATQHQGFIPALRERNLVLNMGAQLLPGLVGDLEIPSMGDANFYHVGEDVDVTDSTPATAAISMSPTTIGGSVPISRRLWKQSSPGVEPLLRSILAEGVAVEMDAKIINGSGAAAQPLGILNQTGIGTSTIATPGQPTWAELVEFETDVLTAKALAGSLGYLLAPAVQTHCKTTLKASGVAGYLMEEGKINGYRALPSTNVPTNGILFGDFSRCLVGLWGGIDIKADEATKAAAGGLVMRIFADYDVALEHADAFSKNA